MSNSKLNVITNEQTNRENVEQVEIKSFSSHQKKYEKKYEKID